MERNAYQCVIAFMSDAGLGKLDFKALDRRGVALLRCGEHDTIWLRRCRRRFALVTVAVRMLVSLIVVMVVVVRDLSRLRHRGLEEMVHPVRRRRGKEKQQREGAAQIDGPRERRDMSAGFHLRREILLSSPRNRNGGAIGVRIHALAPDRKRSSLACRFSTLTRTLVPQ